MTEASRREVLRAAAPGMKQPPGSLGNRTVVPMVCSSAPFTHRGTETPEGSLRRMRCTPVS